MRMPTHHLPDEVLLAYATGTLEEAEALLVATHASLCSRCAKTIERHERLGGALLAQAEPASVSEDVLLRTMALLDTAPLERAPTPVRDAVLPAPLARVAGPFEEIKWLQALPIANVFYADLPMTLGGIPVRLSKFRPGTRIPMHSHGATEYDLILTGGVTDHKDGSHFVRGDVSTNDENVTHQLTIDEGEWCVALSVHGARVKPVGLLARLVFGYLGW